MVEAKRRFRAGLQASAAMRYALASLSIAVAVALHLAVIGGLPSWSEAAPLIHPTGLFQICIVAAAWYGGAGPGFVAALLATLVLPGLIAMNYPLTAGFFDLPRFVAFAITALAIGWGTTLWRRAESALRRSEAELRAARGELVMKVSEQTAELRRSEALLARAQHLSQTGSFSWKPATREVVWSQEMFRIWGFDPATKPTGELALRRIHPDDVDWARRAFEGAAYEGRDLDLEHRLLMPDGAVRHIVVAARAVRDDAGDVEFVGVTMDVTERKRAEEALRKAQAQLAHIGRVLTMGELAASIAHEINQPLGAIVANADACRNWLGATTPNVDEARESVDAIARDATRAGEIIKRIRALVQKAEIRKARLDINDAIREVVALAEGEARRHEVTLRTEIADDLPFVIGDRVQLQQVVLNLLMNGIEAMASVTSRRRLLLVRSSHDDRDHVVVAVQDSGVGIGPHELGKIFDTFYTTKPQGMGLGLAISRSIVESHGGKLAAACNDGPGMTFKIALPVEPSPPSV
ncbi:MAG TPA: ATP-binding protein [Vicinamibacterales bacterium]|nr:ATP-binding protein [Vicinamibacterales bacterium]